jgi:transketolase
MKNSIKKLNLLSEDIREDIISMLLEAGSGHSAGPLGSVEIYVALYFEVMNHNPKNPNWQERDILIQSNGHCAPVRYALMAKSGYIKQAELKTLRKFGSSLQGHPERTRIPALETTSGPLGCGLSQAIGMALAMRLMGDLNRRIYVVLGDGELDEGNIWEAAMLASKYQLSNIIAVIDRNNIQIDGPTEEVMPLENLKDKWESFGWHVQDADGHNIEQLVDCLNLARSIYEKPNIIIAHTTPGKGVKFMEASYQWHGVPPNAEQAKLALKELRSHQ